MTRYSPIFAIFALVLPGLTFAEEDKSVTLSAAVEIESDRLGKPIELFNGKDLDGWKAIMTNDQPAEEIWSVKEHAIHCRPQKGAGYIRYEPEQFKNFVLRMEWRFIEPGNSGVLVRCIGEPQAHFGAWPKSIECQVNHQQTGDIWNIGQFPMKVDSSRTKDRQTVKLHESNEKEVGEWNTYEIVLDGGDLRLIVNGLLQNTASDCLETEGWIALQCESAVVEYRNIVLWPIEAP